MVWLCMQMVGCEGWPDNKQLICAAYACTEAALQVTFPDEHRPLIAIRTARACLKGEAALREVKKAVDGSFDAAIEITGAADAYTAACFADYAVRYPEEAVYCADAAMCEAARVVSQKDLASLIRKEIPCLPQLNMEE